MDIEVRKVRDAIAAEFGPEMQRDAITHLWKAYEAAAKAAKDFDPAQRRKTYGHQRLALIEQSFKLFSRKHPHMVADDHREDGGTYEYFTMASASLLLTIKAVSAPDRLPKATTFRDTLAAGMNYPMFEEAPVVFGKRKFYHVMLLHNCERKLVRDDDTGDYRKVRVLSRPGFVTLAVPERDGKGCIVKASLFRDHPETVAQLRGLNVADVPEAQQNKPRARPMTAEGLDTGSK